MRTSNPCPSERRMRKWSKQQHTKTCSNELISRAILDDKRSKEDFSPFKPKTHKPWSILIFQNTRESWRTTSLGRPTCISPESKTQVHCKNPYSIACAGPEPPWHVFLGILRVQILPRPNRIHPRGVLSSPFKETRQTR